MEQENQQQEPHFISKWFGFSGWRVMSTKARILTQIIYRAFFLLGLAVLIIAYGTITGSDPGGLAIFALITGWFLAFQVVVNFVFVEGSR
ncbi:MAG: hypothetical protein QMC65_06740 [Candidatus Poseidoniaceae archaeon]|jgi:hypothetical protein|tara:strand:- start:1242 stop:1511 length:270 start_codon:yes stop_codon:yes gene_type:complete